MWKTLFCSILLIFTACGPGTGKNERPEDPLALLVPEWSSLSYQKDGVRVEIMPPFLLTQQIFADAATGSCTDNTIELTFQGTFNPDVISRLEIVGLTAIPEYSGNVFTFIACMAPGAASVTITAYDKSEKAVRVPLSISLNAMTATHTAGFGHPRYPNTGMSLANVSMGAVSGKTTASSGKTGWTLEAGAINYFQLKQVSP